MNNRNKTIYFDSPKDVDKHLQHEIYFFIKLDFLAKCTTKNKFSQLLFKYKH